MAEDRVHRPNRMTCAACGALLPDGILACPACQTLVHRERLRELAQVATTAEVPGDALAAWREALGLLPPGSRQRDDISRRILDLSRRVDEPAPSTSRGPLGGLVAMVLVVLGKLKFLLLGFTKLGTVLSMFASFGVYASLWGWKFAAGFVLSIYVHEIGHVVALRQFGISATAPMFIPGFGALVRLNQYPATPREDARVGIAGPIWGMFAAIACFGLAVATGSPLVHAIASTGALINLFNLVPIWSLDGGRAYRGMSRPQRGLVAAALLAAWLLTSVPMTLIVALVMAARTAFVPEQPAEGDVPTTAWFVGLAFVLSALASTAPPSL